MRNTAAKVQSFFVTAKGNGRKNQELENLENGT